ncbi:hypothetical protein [Rickettsia endosymbiont of Nabis limbatus]|uniref:hypothetical protein n=1 Tax=Rickettsia endosymbiont of Nabis limbatus TaxID=3066268 RepID=UPI003AF349EE
MLKHYVNDYNEEFVKNIFRQAKENNEKELVENMVKINPGLANDTPRSRATRYLSKKF